MVSSRLLVVRDLLLDGHPATAEEHRDRARARAERLGRAILEDHRTLIAYVNFGRWVADCYHCGSGISLDPTWAEANCYGEGCYHRYVTFLWPSEDERHGIEEALLVRAQRHQNWGNARGIARDPTVPVETIEDLWRENLDRLAPLAPPPAVTPHPLPRNVGNRDPFGVAPLLPADIIAPLDAPGEEG